MLLQPHQCSIDAVRRPATRLIYRAKPAAEERVEHRGCDPGGRALFVGWSIRPITALRARHDIQQLTPLLPGGLR
jgi:hypothetical protein